MRTCLRMLLVIAMLASARIALAQQVPLLISSTLSISCKGLKATHGLCVPIRERLRERKSVPLQQRFANAKAWMLQARIRKKAERAVGALLRSTRSKRNAARLADLGFAHIVAGQIGEGLHNLLLAQSINTSLHAAADGAYVGFILSWDSLEDYQRVDWAGDIAGRLGAGWIAGELRKAKRPRAVEIARVMHLSAIAMEFEAAHQVMKYGQLNYPKSPLWAELESVIPKPAEKKKKKKRRRRRRR
jgi:hypothetical protein